MFTLYHSNQLDVLKALLVELVRRDPLTDPFEREQILVQSPGMAQWLKLELASAFGIAANIDFPLPASFIWQMFIEVLGDVPARSPYNKQSMSWQLMMTLPTLLERPDFAPLRSYLSPQEASPEQVRLWQLCQKVADLFDQYLVYRPDWIERWERGEGLPAELGEVAGQDWQPVLWRELVARTLQLADSGYHRANLFEAFIQALRSGAPLPGRLPKRVFVFGISALPPGYVEALQVLGEHIEVHLFVTNPCRYYWGDLLDRKTMARLERRLRPGTDLETLQGESNPLLASMGKLGRDYLHHLMGLEPPEVEAFVDMTEDTLLHCLQGDVLEQRDRGAVCDDPDSSRHKTVLTAGDHSLQIHACHSPVRELEVLHDRLLDLFERDPTLTPKEVVVMMPDVAGYAPFIQAVFGARGQIPFSISDRAASQESPLLQSFLALLRLPRQRFGAGELLALLEVPAVLRRFALTVEEFDTLRRWVQESGIRWGLDDAYPERFDLPALSGNSWLFGLRRMLLGYAMGEGEPVAGILPYAEIEGQQGVTLGKLAAFVDTLAHFLPQLEQARSLPEWHRLLHALLAACYDPDEDEERHIQLVRDAMAGWQETLGEVRFDEPITPALLQDVLGQALAAQRSSQRFLAGQVNFCTLMPMRSIPFRQVCLLGMNDGVYPRTLPPMGFDLMALASRRGDRSRRDDDRYLFLEALLSAQDGLYISYQGFSVQDNSEREPSVLLAELLDYLRQGFVLAGDEALPDDESGRRLLQALVTAHPLTPYSRDYFFPKDERLFTYAADWLPALTPKAGAGNFQSGDLPLPPEMEGGELELAELLRFYRNPARYFLNRRLKVWFELDDTRLEENEPFALDGLENYQLKDQLLTAHLNEGGTERLRERLRLAGQLPQSWFGPLLLDELDDKMAGLAERVRPLRSEKTPVEIDIPLPQGRLLGWLDSEQGKQLIVKPGSFHGRDWLQGWLRHLCLCLSRSPGETLLLDGLKSWRLPVLAPEVARRHLLALVDDWVAGLRHPLPLFPKSAWSWLGEQEKSGDEEKALRAARTSFEGGWQLMGEGEDPYIQRCFPALDEAVMSQLIALARTHLLPLYQALEEID